MGDFKEVKIVIKSIVSSSPHILNVERLKLDYRRIQGHAIPFERFGYDSLDIFLRCMTDTITVKGNGWSATVHPVVTPQSKHIIDMVRKQKRQKQPNWNVSGQAVAPKCRDANILTFRLGDYESMRPRSPIWPGSLDINMPPLVPAGERLQQLPENTGREQQIADVPKCASAAKCDAASKPIRRQPLKKCVAYADDEPVLDTDESAAQNKTENVHKRLLEILKRRFNLDDSQLQPLKSICVLKNEDDPFTESAEENPYDCLDATPEFALRTFDPNHLGWPKNAARLDHGDRFYIYNLLGNIEKGDVFKISICEIVDPSLFHFHMVNNSKLEQINGQLTDFYANFIPRLDYTMAERFIRPGQVCAIYRHEQWYRGEILSGVYGGRAIVSLVDYGIYRHIKTKYIKYLPKNFLRIARQSLLGKLWCVQPLNGASKWSREAVKWFTLAVLNKQLYTKFKQVDCQDVHAMVVCEINDGKEFQINSQLAIHGHADVVDPPKVPTETPRPSSQNQSAAAQ